MPHYIKKVNYKVDLILRDRSSSGICFVYTKTDLFLCFLFYEMTEFFYHGIVCPARPLLFQSVNTAQDAHTHTPTFLQ